MFSKFIVKKSSYFSCFLLPIRIQTWRWVQTIREQIAVLTSWHRLRIFQLSICCTISGGRALGRNNRWFKSNENAGEEAKKMMRFWQNENGASRKRISGNGVLKLFCKFAAGLLKPSDAEYSTVHMLYNKFILLNVFKVVCSIAVNFTSCAIF